MSCEYIHICVYGFRVYIRWQRHQFADGCSEPHAPIRMCVMCINKYVGVWVSCTYVVCIYEYTRVCGSLCYTMTKLPISTYLFRSSSLYAHTCMGVTYIHICLCGCRVQIGWQSCRCFCAGAGSRVCVHPQHTCLHSMHAPAHMHAYVCICIHVYI